MTPTSIVNANPSSTSPPNTYSASTAKPVVPDVISVRASVWLTLTLTSRSNRSRRIRRRFSRTRSNTTMESFTE